MRHLRVDRGELQEPKVLPNGFLRADAYLTRTGVFTYQNSNGSVRRELRIPDEVFSKDSLDSLAGTALTLGHPNRPVTADNARELSVGSVGVDARREDDKIRATITVQDGAAIKSMKASAREISCGYWCDFDPSPGVTKDIEGIPNGLAYDGIQRNISHNHAAVVPRGRAGPEIRARFDSPEWNVDDAQIAWHVESTASLDVPGDSLKAQVPERQRSNLDGESTMEEFKIKIGGVTYTLKGDSAAEQALTNELAANAASTTQLKADASAREDVQKSALDAEKARADTEKARADAAEEKATEAEKSRADAVDPAAVQAQVKARVALETAAHKVLGEKLNSDGSDDDLRRAVIAEKCPKADLADKSDAYIMARFDAVMESLDAQDAAAAKTNVGQVRAAAEGAADGASRLDEARAAFLKRNQDAWKTPLNASKDRSADPVSIKG